MRMRVPRGASPVVRGAAVDGEAQPQRKQAGQRRRRALGGSFVLFAAVVPRWSMHLRSPRSGARASPRHTRVTRHGAAISATGRSPLHSSTHQAFSPVPDKQKQKSVAGWNLDALAVRAAVLCEP